MSRKSKKRKKGLDRKKRSTRGRNKNRRFQKNKLLDRMKKSQQQAEGGMGVIRGDADVTIWRPGDGSHIIDIIPYEVGKYNVDGDEPGEVHYTFRYFLHRNVGPGNKLVICPLKTWGKDCPICEERQRLIDNGSDWEKMVKPLFPKERYIYNIVCYDRGEEKKGVQVWDVSNHYFQKHIITLSKKPTRGGRDEQNILFFDEEEGKSISFTIEPAQSKDDFAEYVAHSFDERDYTISDDLLDSAHCLDEIVEIHSYEDIKKMFFGRSGSNRNDDSDDNSGDSEDNTLRDLLSELDDLEDNDELRDFCEDNGLDVKIKGGKRFFSRNVDNIKEALEAEYDDDDDDDDDDDEPDYTVEEIEEMNFRKLKKLVEEEALDIDLEDFSRKDADDLRDEIIAELGLE